MLCLKDEIKLERFNFNWVKGNFARSHQKLLVLDTERLRMGFIFNIDMFYCKYLSGTCRHKTEHLKIPSLLMPCRYVQSDKF